VPVSATEKASRPVLNVGHTFVSGGRTITESDIVSFACLSGDFNRIHVDAEYAATTAYGKRIAHGLLVLSVMSGLTTQSSGYRALEPFVLALLDIHCRFPRPTFIGDTIFVRITVTETILQFKPGRDKVVFRREAVNQRGDVVVQADFSVLMHAEAGA